MDARYGETTDSFRTIPLAWSWRDVLRVSAIAELLVLLLTVVTLRDLLATALAVILMVGLSMLLLRGKLFGFVFEMIARVLMLRLPEEIAGALILGFLFADIGFYTLTGTAANLWNGASGAAIVLPGSLAAFAVSGFVAAAMCVFRRSRSTEPNPTAVNFVLGVFMVTIIVLGIGLLRGQSVARAAPPSDVKLVVENMSYSGTAINAHPGSVTVSLENHDLFWHTFTIEQLDVDLKVPMQAREQVRFDATPGVYTFHCTIPGHEMLGMSGTLTVR